MCNPASGLGIRHLQRVGPDCKGDGLSGDANANATLRLSVSRMLSRLCVNFLIVKGDPNFKHPK